MFSGSRAYNREIRIYKILYESFSPILFHDFELACTSGCNGILQILDDLNETYDFIEFLESNEQHESCASLITYKDNLTEKSALSKFLLKFLKDTLKAFNDFKNKQRKCMK